MLGREIVRVFGQAPLAGLADRLPTEGAPFCADDEPTALEGLEGEDRRVLADVQILGGLPNTIGNAAIVSAIVPPGELYVERPRVTRQAAPGGRVHQPKSKPDEALSQPMPLSHRVSSLHGQATPSSGRRRTCHQSSARIAHSRLRLSRSTTAAGMPLRAITSACFLRVAIRSFSAVLCGSPASRMAFRAT